MDYQFHDNNLRVRALTHRSAGAEHNERLEFFGDALLELIITEHLFMKFPEADEGELTRARSLLVNKKTLSAIARNLSLGDLIILGEGEKKSGGWCRDSILANTLEALIAAIYLDAGIDTCRRVIKEWFAECLYKLEIEGAAKDAKTSLQESLQSRRCGLPRYETIAVTGPPHQRTFTVACYIEFVDKPTVAEGSSRRKAEQAAARAALALLEGTSG